MMLRGRCLDWDGLQRIMDRAVARDLALRSTEEVTRVALDEKSFSRSQAFVSVLTDHRQPRVLEAVARSHHRSSAGTVGELARAAA